MAVLGGKAVLGMRTEMKDAGGGGDGLVTKSCLALVTPWTVAGQAPLCGISQARIPE